MVTYFRPYLIEPSRQARLFDKEEVVFLQTILYICSRGNICLQYTYQYFCWLNDGYQITLNSVFRELPVALTTKKCTYI